MTCIHPQCVGTRHFLRNAVLEDQSAIITIFFFISEIHCYGMAKRGLWEILQW